MAAIHPSGFNICAIIRILEEISILVHLFNSVSTKWRSCESAGYKTSPLMESSETMYTDMFFKRHCKSVNYFSPLTGEPLLSLRSDRQAENSINRN
jgi:hypothetical protein